ncbi:hypothetical protein HanHA89_Chr17g0724161 [Helianthus annuus]|nr:hypothetical protein HanHA89_Chr17g0724161 [Helianthus annuus]
MAVSVAKLCKPICSFSFTFVRFSYPIHTISSQQLLEQSIKSAIEAKTYRQIADIFNASKEASQASNPFSFLSNFHHQHRAKIIDEILQSFIPLRPRNHPQRAYAYLLSFIPYIKVRQKVFDGLAAVGELEFAYILKMKFTELNS